MTNNVSVDDLFARYIESLKPVLVPVLVLHVIDKHTKASSSELKAELAKIHKEIEYNYTSYYRLMGKLEHEYHVIEPVEVVKAKGPARIYYGLTPTGKALLGKIRQEVILPLKKYHY